MGHAYLVSLLLVLVSLLVCSSFRLVWGSLLVVEGLPSLTEDLADLAYYGISMG